MVKKLGGAFLLVCLIVVYVQQREERRPTTRSYAQHIVKLIDAAGIGAHLDSTVGAIVIKASGSGARSATP